MLELNDSNFYYLELNDKKFVFSNYEKAVSQLKDRMDDLDTEDLGEDDIGLFEVGIDSEGEWTIKETSWFEFALELMKGD